MIRFALIGCGDIGQLRASALAGCDAVEPTVVCDLDAERASALGSRVGAEVETDWERAVARPDVDAVLVSTPPSSHAEICVGALRGGKHVLCEKPLARSPAECLEIVTAGEAADRVVATGFNYRFYPSVVKARELLDEGRIGELSHIRSYTGYSADEHSHAWLRDPEVMGGGALRDNGIHLIDLTLYFLGDAEEVLSLSSGSVWGFEGAEDNGFALLRSAAGKIATLHASWSEWRGYRFGLELYGERGCVRVSCFPMVTDVVWSERRGGKTRRRIHLFPKTHLLEKLRSYRWVVTRSFEAELAAFARAVAGEATPLATGRDGLRAVEVAAASPRSAETPEAATEVEP